ncbi:MAG: hypothetical protein AB7I12_04135, partial [Steroidobacteraceae bacterium]
GRPHVAGVRHGLNTTTDALLYVALQPGPALMSAGPFVYRHRLLITWLSVNLSNSLTIPVRHLATLLKTN